MRDLVGIGWRGEWAAEILAHEDEIEVFEVIAEDWMRLPRREQRALRQLGADRPLLLHGVAMGLASAVDVEATRLDRMARLVEEARPVAWSEHLAFVRGGGREIGHLAAPPRTASTIEGTARNVRRASQVVGSVPALENIATLVEPPVSSCGETAWTRAIVAETGAPMLLDLHNLLANALNFGAAPEAMLEGMPLDSVEIVHLSGGRWLQPPSGRARLLDDHLHDVPDPVFALLSRLAASAPRPLHVIIERDGNYPAFAAMSAQMRRAREALAHGRGLRAQRKAA